MTRALVTQMLEALEYVVDQGGGPLCEHEAGICFCKENTAIEAAREYLATEPIGERAELISELRDFASFALNVEIDYQTEFVNAAADMLEADALEIESIECAHTEQVLRAMAAEENLAQQATRLPMTEAHQTLLDMAANIEKFGK